MTSTGKATCCAAGYMLAAMVTLRPETTLLSPVLGVPKTTRAAAALRKERLAVVPHTSASFFFPDSPGPTPSVY